MFKKIFAALMIVLPLSVFAQRFATVDVQPIIQELPEYATMQQQITEASQRYEQELSALHEEFQRKYAEYQANLSDTTVPQSIMERRQTELQELDAKIQQFYATAQQDLQRLQQQLMAPIETKVMDAIKAVGQEGNYTFIAPYGLFYFQGAAVEDASPAVKAKLGL